MVKTKKKQTEAIRKQLMLKWARQYTTEKLGSEFSPELHYLEPELVTEDDDISFPVNALVNQLEHPEGQLFRILGPVGIGKTMLREWLASKIPYAVSLELDESDVIEQLNEIYEDDEDEDDVREVDLVIKALIEKGILRRFDPAIPILVGPSGNDDISRLVAIMTVKFDEANKSLSWKTDKTAPAVLDELRGTISRLLGKKKMTQIELEFNEAVISAYDNIIVDFRDYDERRPSQMRKDIDRLRNFWKRKRKNPPNMVVFWQQELVDKKHFWWGKFKRLRIKPFAPEQLADFFIELFDDSPDPFTRDALIYVADAARGIFRRFKECVAICLMKQEVNLIEVEHVREWLPSKDSEEVISQELSHVFPRSENNRRRAVKVLQYLKENGPTSQPDITKQFFGSADSDQVAGVRMMRQLEKHGHIQRSYDGHKKIISLTEESDKNE